MSPLALGTSHAPTESIVAAFQGTEYDTGLDLVLLSEIRDYLHDFASEIPGFRFAGSKDVGYRC